MASKKIMMRWYNNPMRTLEKLKDAFVHGVGFSSAALLVVALARYFFPHFCAFACK